MKRLLLVSVLLLFYILPCFSRANPAVSGPISKKVAEGQYGGMGKDDKGQSKTVIADEWSLYQLPDQTYRVDIKKMTPSNPDLETTIKLTLDSKFHLQKSDVRMTVRGEQKISLTCAFEPAILSCAGKNPDSPDIQDARVKPAGPYALLPDPVGSSIDMMWFQALVASQVQRVPGKETNIQLFSFGDGSDFRLESNPDDSIRFTYQGTERIKVLGRDVLAHKFTSAESTVWTSDKGLLLRMKLSDSPDASMELMQYKQFTKWESDLQ
jgi:hypothetical protein